MNLRWVVICLFLTPAYSESDTMFGVINEMYNECQNKTNLIKCLKIQVLQVTDKALNSSKLQITEDLSLVPKETEFSRNFPSEPSLMELDQLNPAEIDAEILNRLIMFIKTRRLSLNVSNSEARGKKKKNFIVPFIAALGIKTFFMSVAYKGVAMMSGAAILIGKIALILSALLGLKKLIHSGHEQTTVEIVKQPHYSHSHTQSFSHEHDGGGGNGGYYKNIGSEEEMSMQDRIYNGPYRGHVSRF